METDDDYQLFSPPQQPSPPIHHRKLKRLKKSIDVSSNSDSAVEDLPIPIIDSFESQSPESHETLGSENLDEPLRSQSPSLSFHEDRKETRRALDFDELIGEFEGKRSDKSDEIEENVSDLNSERLEKKRLSEEDLNENEVKKKKTKKNKRDKSVGGDDLKPKKSKKREEKERENYLQQLHVESQRLLRETRDATFKPIPVVQKPISSILEKIRQRKLEVMKKTVNLQSNRSFSENIGSFIEGLMDHDSENISIREREVDQIAELVQEETIVCHLDVESSLHASHADGSEEAVTQTSDENSPSQMDLDEQSTSAFRAPVDDTQDLFCDSQTSEEKDDTSNDQNNSPLEEVLAPSLLAMNLKFDSAPPDDISSDEEDNDKENIEPEPDRDENGHSSPKGDPVKAFVDDEAVEEDDSDNDLLRFQENEEDEGIEDYEELNDLIATECDEKPIDNERRNELHQKWLEQQDRAGTDNLLQRLKYGSKLKDTTLLEEEGEEDDEDVEEFGDEVAEDPAKASGARINSRKAKQMIPQMFSEKNDGYLSSDEEEVEKRLVKQRLLDKAEDQDTLLSPVEDESSRQVFGLIKKLNIAPDAKKKAKTSSFFDKMLTGRNNDSSSSKSSFLGRAPSHSLPLSHKQGSGTVRSFIFGRDDSNSRSSISMSEDSSDAIPLENRPTRSTVSKFSSSQSKSSTQTQSTKNTAETVNGASLFEVLKRSSLQSNVCHQDNMVGLTQTVFAAFKIPKKPIKIEGRT